uniref:Uncharacterized protein n=1 Tax=Arundo donax TaxID=35708 RepID=A0A0A9AUF9_ARUDO
MLGCNYKIQSNPLLARPIPFLIHLYHIQKSIDAVHQNEIADPEKAS